MESVRVQLSGNRIKAYGRIVAAATELFARQGYERTSVQEIVAAAQVTKGAMYHWFGSKSELLNSIYRELLAEQTARLEAIATGTGPVDVRLREAALDLVGHIAAHPEELTVWSRSRHLLDEAEAATARQERRRYHQVFRDLVQEGQAAGVLRSDVSATVATHTFLSAIGNLHQWFRPTGPLPRDEVGRQMVGIFLRGLEPLPLKA
jgi:AcrR family transcriptional regulator